MDTIVCPQCQEKLQASPEYVGRQVQCPTCKHIFVVPGDAAPPPPRAGTEITAASSEPMPPPTEDDRRPRRPRERDAVYDEDWDDRDLRRGYREPHRGAMILTLGILSIVLCGPVCGPIAWILGHQDLEKIRAGQMDRTGEGITQAGYVCGIIGTILGILGLILGCLYLIMMMSFVRAFR
jgi:hypothetical protein